MLGTGQYPNLDRARRGTGVRCASQRGQTRPYLPLGGQAGPCLQDCEGPGGLRRALHSPFGSGPGCASSTSQASAF